MSTENDLSKMSEMSNEEFLDLACEHYEDRAYRATESWGRQWAAIIAELARRTTVPPGHIKLPTTVDGKQLLPGLRVWRLDDAELIDGTPWEGWVVDKIRMGPSKRWVVSFGLGDVVNPTLYSTREAALAAKEGG